ncbi:two-component-system connector protein AriR [Pantoea rodasii]|uniref:Two-component-system connector protein AriR n=1 Tax=Pantoea rodasii TaxID=1076549 RepID=A0A0B1R7V0_9GAMM|nr:biofilm development regulator YmgB/AriR family protein [Pantoea rodasii]KHJ67145.1 two-component-system connector protein AriR [Pantoea rodasii]
MQKPQDTLSAIPDEELAMHFRENGAVLSDEAAVLGMIIPRLLATEGHVSNKSIILSLISALESTNDEAEMEILRKTLGIVVGYTPDDA